MIQFMGISSGEGEETKSKIRQDEYDEVNYSNYILYIW